MLPQPPQPLEAAAPKACLLSTVLRRSRQPYEVAAAMAMVLSAMARPLAAWCAARPRQSLGALSSAPALKKVVSSSSVQQLFGDVHYGVCWQWLWLQLALHVLLREHAARATVQRRPRGLRAARARRSWAPRVGARLQIPVRVPAAAHASVRAARVVTTHERRPVGTQRLGWSRRVIPRSDACSVPCSKLVYDMFHMCTR
jgi:hypothetical protein